MLKQNEPEAGLSKAGALEPRITDALRRAGREAMIRHKRDGFPVVSWRHGKVVVIQPEDIVIPPADDPSPAEV